MHLWQQIFGFVWWSTDTILITEIEICRFTCACIWIKFWSKIADTMLCLERRWRQSSRSLKLVSEIWVKIKSLQLLLFHHYSEGTLFLIRNRININQLPNKSLSVTFSTIIYPNCIDLLPDMVHRLTSNTYTIHAMNQFNCSITLFPLFSLPEQSETIFVLMTKLLEIYVLWIHNCLFIWSAFPFF